MRRLIPKEGFSAMSQTIGPLARSPEQCLEPGTILKIIPHQQRGVLEPDCGRWLVFWFENCPDAAGLNVGDRVVFEAIRTEARLEAWSVAPYECRAPIS